MKEDEVAVMCCPDADKCDQMTCEHAEEHEWTEACEYECSNYEGALLCREVPNLKIYVREALEDG